MGNKRNSHLLLERNAKRYSHFGQLSGFSQKQNTLTIWYSQSYGFSSNYVWMWELDHKKGWALKNWCFWTVVLDRTLENPLDWKEIKPVNPKGNQSWIFIGGTDAEAEAPILWPPDGKSQLIGKRPWCWESWRQEAKGMTENKMVRWHHWLNGHELHPLTPNKWSVLHYDNFVFLRKSQNEIMKYVIF